MLGRVHINASRCLRGSQRHNPGIPEHSCTRFSKLTCEYAYIWFRIFGSIDGQAAPRRWRAGETASFVVDVWGLFAPAASNGVNPIKHLNDLSCFVWL
jgi:hypothetical protein